MPTKTLTAQETSKILGAKFGSLRAWDDFLADCRRNKTNLDGHTLLPFGRVYDGKCNRPLYSVDDIIKFIKVIKGIYPDSKPKTDFNFIEVDCDYEDSLHWKLRKLKTIH